jgi:hypothetical protein
MSDLQVPRFNLERKASLVLLVVQLGMFISLAGGVGQRSGFNHWREW